MIKILNHVLDVDKSEFIAKSKKNILLIGNSRQVINDKFKDKHINFNHVCRFNHNWANIYDHIKMFTGNRFDTLIVSNYAHNKSIEELVKNKLLNKVKQIYLICPNANHKYTIKKSYGIPYYEISDAEYEELNRLLFQYGFPLQSKNPRTGFVAILYFSFFKKYNVYIHGFDVEGIDDPNNQHVQDNIKIDEASHDIYEESTLLKQLVKDKHVFIY